MVRIVSVLLALAFSTVAWAQGTAPAFSLQTFRPAVDSKGLVTVNSSQTLSHLEYSLGLVGSYANRPLSLVHDDAQLHVDHFVTVQLQAALGLFGGGRWLTRLHGISFQLGLSLPVHIMAGSRTTAATTDDTPGRTFSGQFLGDLGLNLKARFLNTSKHHVGLALLVAVDLPTGKSEQFLGEGQTTVRPALILDAELGRSKRWKLALNVGAIVRPNRHTYVDATTTGLSRSVGTQLTYSLGASYAVVPQRLDLVAEIFGAHDLTGGLTGEHSATPLEAVIAAKVYLAESSYFEIGAGAGLLPPRFVGGESNMTGAPLGRVFVGFVFEPRVGDRDHDGIKDDVDKCPDDPETYNGFDDEDGCPDERPRDPEPVRVPLPELEPEPEPIPEPEPRRIIVHKSHIETLEKVYFKTASAEILPRSFPLLKQIAEHLRNNGSIRLLEVAGHADERGRDDYNLQLTEARARSVRDYLVSLGVEASRLTARGYGKTRPATDPKTLAPCAAHTERCWDMNRRVEFVIVVN